jgi:hypothetical protein
MKRFSIIILTIGSMFFTQCEVLREGCMDPAATNYSVAADISDNSCIYDGCTDPSAVNYNPKAQNDNGTCTYDSVYGGCQPHLEGNLSVTNETDDVLLLYNNLSYVGCIPAGAENFILNIANQNNEVLVLQVWKSVDVQDKTNPNLSQVYRQWSVALSNTTLPTERANWLITAGDANMNSGTLLLSYPAFDEYNQEVIYQVDIFLNSQNGARLASLQPGVENKKVSVDYGIHYLYFRYWYSDPDSPSSEITEIGWNEIRDIVINAEHETDEIDIPVFYSIIGKYGFLKVFNTTASPVSIYANNNLIEKIAKVEGSPDGLSIIPAGKSTTFLIPEEAYTIAAKSIDGITSIISFRDVNVIQSDTATLHIGGKHKEISVTNSTTFTLLLYSEDGHYLGKVMEPGESTGTYQVNSEYDSLLVITPNRVKKKKIAAEMGVIVTDLDDFISQDFNITSAWDIIGSGHYRSPDINDSESTSMTATLFNTNNVLLSFEYKVSSEYEYDVFNFSLNNTVKITSESGETQWKNYSVNIPPGYHTLTWEYIKDSMFSIGTDDVEIRNIVIN